MIGCPYQKYLFNLNGRSYVICIFPKQKKKVLNLVSVRRYKSQHMDLKKLETGADL